MKLISSFLSLLLLASCGNHKEVVQETYPDGQKKIVHIRSPKDSLVKVIGYRESGKLSFTGFLDDDGKWDSTHTQWYIDVEQEQWQSSFEDHVRHGQETYWYRNGQKEHEVSYTYGKKHGLETQWYENGSKKAEGHWDEGRQVGEWSYWHPNGLLKSRGHYRGGHFEELPMFSSRSEPVFIPLKDGLWTYWSLSGTIERVEHWEEGKLVEKE